MLHCDFCYHHCAFKKSDDTGFCRQRTLKDGKLISVNYGKIEALAVDPVEKKPLYHFLPGTYTLSLAQSGCNFKCTFCQNWTLSQNDSNTETTLRPEDIVRMCISQGLPSISFTYSEPLVWQDFLIDCATAAKSQGLSTIMVTNGSFSDEALERISPVIDAYNIDLKGDAAFYEKICEGSIIPVKRSIKYLSERGKHVEITSLLIEGIHTIEWIKAAGAFLNSAGVNVWHLSRFFPNYKMLERKETSESFLQKAVEAAYTTGVPFIYGGNTSLNYETRCPECGQTLIPSRGTGFSIKTAVQKNIIDGNCRFCGKKIYGKFQYI